MKIKSIFNRKRTIIIGVFVGLLSVFLVSYDDQDFEIMKNMDIYYTMFRELNLFYVDETDPGDLIKTSIDEMLKSLDPYTVYIPESKIEDYRFMTTGQYGGVGALIRKVEDQVVIADPYENFPVAKAGLRAGDIILEIDGNSTTGKSTRDVSEKLKGNPNTELNNKSQKAIC